MTRRFQLGEWVRLREVWDGKTWELRRGIIVQDDDAAIAIYTPLATPALVAAGPDGVRLRIPPPEWPMAEVSTPPDRHFLAVHPPGAEHSTLCIWDANWRMLMWYINLESDLQRTEWGFDYEDRMLDVIVKPDMSAWRWKDEDELEEGMSRGHFTPTDAEQFYAEGKRAVERLLARGPPYDVPWEDWRPPPGWTADAAPTEWR